MGRQGSCNRAPCHDTRVLGADAAPPRGTIVVGGARAAKPRAAARTGNGRHANVDRASPASGRTSTSGQIFSAPMPRTDGAGLAAELDRERALGEVDADRAAAWTRPTESVAGTTSSAPPNSRRPRLGHAPHLPPHLRSAACRTAARQGTGIPACAIRVRACAGSRDSGTARGEVTGLPSVSAGNR